MSIRFRWMFLCVLLVSPVTVQGQEDHDAAWRQRQVDEIIQTIGHDLRPDVENYGNVEKQINKLESIISHHPARIRDPFPEQIQETQQRFDYAVRVRDLCRALIATTSTAGKNANAEAANVILRERFRVRQGLNTTGNAQTRNAEAERWIGQMERTMEPIDRRRERLRQLHERFLAVTNKSAIEASGQYRGTFDFGRIIVNGFVRENATVADERTVAFTIDGANVNEGTISWRDPPLDDEDEPATRTLPLTGEYDPANRTITLRIGETVTINGQTLTADEARLLREAFVIKGTIDTNTGRLTAGGEWKLTLNRFSIGVPGGQTPPTNIEAQGAWRAESAGTTPP